MVNKLKHSVKTGASKFFKSVALTGGMLLFVLKPGISKGNEDLKAELQKVLKEHSVTEWKIQESDKNGEKTAKFESIKDSVDPYDQIKSYVEAKDTTYFMQLKKYMETKDNNEQIKCKAVVYAILQDTLLTTEQKKILALSQFEILAKMPGSDYRFSKKSGERLKTHPDDLVYKDRVQRYLAYKTYLSNLALDQEIAKLKEKSKQLDEKSKQLDEKQKQLERELQLRKQLLDTYKQK